MQRIFSCVGDFAMFPFCSSVFLFFFQFNLRFLKFVQTKEEQFIDEIHY